MNATRSVLFGLALLAFTGVAAAQNRCLTVADAQMTVGKTPQGFYYDHRTSNGTAYSQDCNKKYTVDITVPGTYSLPKLGMRSPLEGASIRVNSRKVLATMLPCHS